MRTPSNSELLAIWERGYGEDPVGRALTLLSACFDESQDDLARLSIGKRDGKLIEVYEHLFGPALEAFAECPACKEPLAYSVSTRDLLAPHPQADPAALSLETEDAVVTLRLPDSFDLRAAAACNEPAHASRELMKRCIVRTEIDGHLVSPEDTPEHFRSSIASALAMADPQAEMLIDLSCRACGHAWQVVLDIERFLWSRISAAAKRLLRDVHALALVYGWPERDILALSAARRQSYLELAWPTS